MFEVVAASQVPGWGAAMLGVFIGYMVWYFIVRLPNEKYTTDGLIAVVGVIAGGLVIEFLKGGGLNLRDRWWYPIGLAIGWGLFILFNLLNWIARKIWPTADEVPPLRALIPPGEPPKK